jgi:hypothetical protein
MSQESRDAEGRVRRDVFDDAGALVRTDEATLLGGEELYDPTAKVKGVYARYPVSTPKYLSSEGRDTYATRDGAADLRVARIYLTNSTVGEGTSAQKFGTSFSAQDEQASLFQRGYVGFLLSQVTENRQEKAQVLPLNGDNYAAYFPGRMPTTFSFSGYLLNTRQDQWRTVFTELYEKVFRGSKAAIHGHLVQIAYDQQVVTGTMTNLTQVLSAANELYTQFQFDLLVKHVFREVPERDIAASTFLGDTALFAAADVRLPDYDAVGALTKTAAVAPPPKRKRGKGRGKGKCKLQLLRGTSNQKLRPTDSVLRDNAECATEKNARRIDAKITRIDKKLAKLKVDSAERRALERKKGDLANELRKAEARSRETAKIFKQIANRDKTGSSFVTYLPTGLAQDSDA